MKNRLFRGPKRPRCLRSLRISIAKYMEETGNETWAPPGGVSRLAGKTSAHNTSNLITTKTTKRHLETEVKP